MRCTSTRGFAQRCLLTTPHVLSVKLTQQAYGAQSSAYGGGQAQDAYSGQASYGGSASGYGASASGYSGGQGGAYSGALIHLLM